MDRFLQDYKNFRAIPKQNRNHYLQLQFLKQQVDQDFNPPHQTYQFQNTFLSFNKNKLRTYATKAQKPKALVVLFHGLNSNALSYAHFAKYLKQEHDITTYSLDQEGFGKSQGYNGIITSAQQTINDSIRFIKTIKQQNKQLQGIKTFIGGLSYGGAICFKISMIQPDLFDGIIFLAPAIQDHPYNSPYLKKLVRFIGWLMPSIKTIEPNFQQSSKYVKYKEYVKNDPLLYTGRVVPGSLREVLNLMYWCNQNYDKIKKPYILIQGTMDKLVNPFLALDLQQNAKSQDKTTIIIDGLWHGITSDPLVYQILPIIGQWIQKRC